MSGRNRVCSERRPCSPPVGLTLSGWRKLTPQSKDAFLESGYYHTPVEQTSRPKLRNLWFAGCFKQAEPIRDASWRAG